MLFVSAVLMAHRDPMDDKGKQHPGAMASPEPEVLAISFARPRVHRRLIRAPVTYHYYAYERQGPWLLPLEGVIPTEFRSHRTPVAVRNVGPARPTWPFALPVHSALDCVMERVRMVKTGGGFAKDNSQLGCRGGKTQAALIVKLGDEVLLYAESESFQ